MNTKESYIQLLRNTGSHSSMQKSIHGGGNITHQSRGHEHDQRRHRTDRRLAPAGQHPEPNLDDADHGQHQEEAAHDRADCRANHPEPEDLDVDVGPDGLVHVLAVEEVDGELEALGDEGGEEEEAEGDDLEDQELLDDVDAGVAGAGVLEAVLGRGGEGEPHEDGDGEEGVHVHEAVEGGHLDARGGGGGGGGGHGSRRVLRVVVLRVRLRSARKGKKER